MSLEADALLERRRLRRQLGIWRILAVLAVVAAVMFGVSRVADPLRGDYVARLMVEGLILEDPARNSALADVAADDKVQALIVHVNSPGGSVVGGEDLYNALRGVAEAKPVAAVMGTLATSAGYMTAVAADRIFAREGTVTGSIGVIFQTTEITGLLEKLGVSAEAIKSAPLKAQPSPLEPLTPAGREATQAIVRDMFDFFVDLVTEHRDLTRSDVLTLADGRIYTGRQGVANGLVDSIGNEGAALAWLVSDRGIGADLPIIDVTIDRGTDLRSILASAVAEKTLFSKVLTLDGLIALWHPDLR